MKKLYAVLEVAGEGRPEPLKASATIFEICRATLRDHWIIETFNTLAEAEDRARELVRERPLKTFHVVESVRAVYTDAPVKSVEFR